MLSHREQLNDVVCIRLSEIYILTMISIFRMTARKGMER